ncbi:DNA polymerase Y family protein [Streptomyces sp. CS7]|uniref:DNA polymerase Y family protein n=1 Tax=Streptomyces sp. CS-7 TaxID=2906769 RepID=UPI0021B45E68|nr:DNA polymerase Y family protein [Streptomyces sp. CS-7]MCT6780424.1 DNA polymerase Y family protein [Streptomyces sp. CS-7]
MTGLTGARVVVVWVPDFPVLACGAVDEVPVAVVYRDALVACSASARAAGVRRRMRVRTALARCPGLRVVERDLAAEVRRFEPVIRRVEEAVLPRLEVIRPGLITAPARGASRYWGGEQQLRDRLVDTVAELGLPAQAGIADSTFVAALAARRQKGVIVPAGEDAAWLASYPVGVLGVPRLTELLPQLGIRTVGAFARLPAGRVAERLGVDGVAAHRIARGEATRPVTVQVPGENYAVGREFEPAEARVDPLVFVAVELADELHVRLGGAGVVCARVEAVVETADGRSLTRLFRHEGRLSSRAVAERLRGVLGAWSEAGVLDVPGGEPGVRRLVLRPEALTPDTGRQQAFAGERDTPVEVERAAARIQAMLGHRAVTRITETGGRGPSDRIRLVPVGDVDERPGRLDGPWLGSLPAPHPAAVYPVRRAARLTGPDGSLVGVSARMELSAAPAVLAIDGRRGVEVTGWAGPWPLLEQWWDSEDVRRIARMQVTTEDGHAWLLLVDHSRWWVEAHYG